MSLTVKHLNADASFLLTFAHDDPTPSASSSSTSTTTSTTTTPPTTPPFTILLDPWLTGPSHIYHPRFSLSTHAHPPTITTLARLPPPHLLIVSQSKSDHCHEATLRTLPPASPTLILAAPAAARLIRSWNHFRPPARIEALAPYAAPRRGGTENKTVTRIPIPALAPGGARGEVTVAYIPQKRDVTGLHSAIGLTYLPPTAAPSPPPAPLTLLFTPHGIAPPSLRPYATTHLRGGPLTALLHPLATVSAPWCLGGTICPGLRGGAALARALQARVWVGAHDEVKTSSGVAMRWVRREGWGEVGWVGGEDEEGEGEGGKGQGTEVLVLGVGEEVVLR